MALYQSKWATRQRITPNSGCAGAEVAQLFEYTLSAAEALAANDIIELAVLPAGNVVTDAILVCDDLDTSGSATLAFDVGLMSGEVGDTGARTCGAELFAASTLGQAGGVARATLASAFTIAPSDKDRSIGVKVKAAPATQANGAKLRLLLKYAAV